MIEQALHRRRLGPEIARRAVGLLVPQRSQDSFARGHVFDQGKGFGLTNLMTKSRTERVKVHSTVSGTERDGAPTQLGITIWSGEAGGTIQTSGRSRL